jgi:hypothetical protein
VSDAERLRQAAQKIRNIAEQCIGPLTEARGYEWQMAKASLSTLGFTRVPVALAVADGLEDAASDLDRIPGMRFRDSTWRLVDLILDGGQ